jgi:EAL domain-containing protein (putative c-di-GMP-specific phosphodiesterase class I)
MRSATTRADARLAGRLRRAVEMNEFIVHYQPIVQLANAGVVGVEALVRWRRSDGTLVPPADFIPIAEDMGLIVPIGRIVMCEAMRQTSVWQLSSPKMRHLQLHVNLSARHLRQPDVVADFVDALETTGYDPAKLTVELTETALMHDAPMASEQLEELHALGVRIALDDFGTGYSALSYVLNFPINVLKIDRSLVSDIVRGDDDARLARAIIVLALALELETVAEGIEEPAQVAELVRMRCEMGQGYHFARPLSARAMTAYLRSAHSGTSAVANATAALAG